MSSSTCHDRPRVTRPSTWQAGVHGEEAMDEMRRVFTETSPWLLGLTMVRRQIRIRSREIARDRHQIPVAGLGIRFRDRIRVVEGEYLCHAAQVVSLLHTLFDMLAFKNDIAFWRNNKSMVGISLQSMLLGLFSQAADLLWLHIRIRPLKINGRRLSMRVL